MVGFTATGQTHESSLLIAGLPSENQGFLIIDNGVFQAAYFVVEVMNKKFTNVSALNTTTLKRYELWNANHLRIDKACWNRDVAGEMNDAIIMLCSPNYCANCTTFSWSLRLELW
jgi:hypothetical protein